MEVNNFQLSPGFNHQVMNVIKEKNFTRVKEIKQLWRFSLLTAASAAILTIVLMVHSTQENLQDNLDLVTNLDEFELTIDYWSNN